MGSTPRSTRSTLAAPRRLSGLAAERTPQHLLGRLATGLATQHRLRQLATGLGSQHRLRQLATGLATQRCLRRFATRLAVASAAASVLAMTLLLGSSGPVTVRSVSANVTLLYFRATSQPPEVKLEWETATELTSVGFYVRRGTALGGPFSRVGAFVPARGDSFVGAKYGATDRPPALSVVYFYQLEEIETSQQSTFYGPTAVFFGPTPSPTTATGPVRTATSFATSPVRTATSVATAPADPPKPSTSAPTSAVTAGSPTRTPAPGRPTSRPARPATTAPPAGPTQIPADTRPRDRSFASPVDLATRTTPSLNRASPTVQDVTDSPRSPDSTTSALTALNAPTTAASSPEESAATVPTWTPVAEASTNSSSALARGGGPLIGTDRNPSPVQATSASTSENAHPLTSPPALLTIVLLGLGWIAWRRSTGRAT